MTSKPYEAGYLAFWDGHQPSFCGFPVGTVEFAEWKRGYEAAKAEVLTAPDTVPMSDVWREIGDPVG